MTAEKADITEERAEFIVSARYGDFASEVLRIAKRCIPDGTGVILAGSTERCVQILRNYMVSTPCKKESTFSDKGKVQAPVRFAALVNGTVGHTMDWVDTAISSTSDQATLLHPTMSPLAGGSYSGFQE